MRRFIRVSLTFSIILILVLVSLISLKDVGREVTTEELSDVRKPTIVQFPLRGEWMAPNTPGTKIPSHGTNKFGTRYAYDFIQVDWGRKGLPSYQGSLTKYLLFGIPIYEYYCWGKEVFAPVDGVVFEAEDGYEEKKRTNIVSDLFSAYKNAHYFDAKTDDVQTIAGNYIIIKNTEDIYAALVHLQKGSIQVKVGQHVKKGEFIGRVGHSGNSFAPHLHFQLMDSSNIATANGLPCAFETYEVFQNNKWKEVVKGIPTNKDRIKFFP